MTANSRNALLFLLPLCFSSSRKRLSSCASEPRLALELAAAASLNDGGSAGGPSLAVEVTPIKEWLELEAGGSALQQRERSGTDLLPQLWTLSRKAEFMAGIGPNGVHTRHTTERA